MGLQLAYRFVLRRLNGDRTDFVFGDFSDGVQGSDRNVVGVLGTGEVEVGKNNARRDAVGDDNSSHHFAAPGSDPHRVDSVQTDLRGIIGMDLDQRFRTRLQQALGSSTNLTPMPVVEHSSGRQE
jgi:hypothetical protein